MTTAGTRELLSVVVPDAQPDDGVLDVAVLGTRTPIDWLRLATQVLLRRQRQPEQQRQAGPPLELFRARRVEVDWDRPQPVERDGDPLDTPRDHLVIEVVPAALTLCVPPAKGPTP